VFKLKSFLKNFLPIILALLIVFLIKEGDILISLINGYEEFRVSLIPEITISEFDITGNSESNINNYAVISETEDSYFYMKDDLILCRSDKAFSIEDEIINKSQGYGLGTLNVVEDWIFYRSDGIRRMELDGSKKKLLAKGFTYDIHIVGNNIYFINVSDDWKLNKMTVNGRNKHSLFDKGISDFAIYKDRIYFSYKENETYKTISMDLEGNDINEIYQGYFMRHLVATDESLFFINKADDCLYRLDLATLELVQLTDDMIFSYVLDDQWVFFMKRENNDPEGDAQGLFRIDLDGKNILVLDENAISGDPGLSIIDEWVLYRASDEHQYPLLQRIKKDGSETVIMQVNE